MRRWPLLARPHHARDPLDVAHRQAAVAMVRIDRTQLDALGGPPLELLHQDLALTGLHHHAVAAADRGGGRDQDDGAVPVGWLHRTARYLERIGMLVVDCREWDLVPAFAHREACIVEVAAGTRLCETDQRHRLGRWSGVLVDKLHE